MGATWVTKAIGLLGFFASSGSYYWPFWAPFLGLMAINCYCSCSCGMRLKLENSRQWGPLSMKDNWVPETIGFVGPIAPSGFRYKKQRYSRPFWGPKVQESREFITDVAFIGYDSLSLASAVYILRLSGTNFVKNVLPWQEMKVKRFIDSHFVPRDV